MLRRRQDSQRARHCSKHFTYFTLFNLHNNPIKQMKSDDLRVLDKETDTQEVKCLAQDYAANTRRRGDLVESLNGLPSLLKVKHGVCVGGERQTHVLSPLDEQRLAPRTVEALLSPEENKNCH